MDDGFPCTNSILVGPVNYLQGRMRLGREAGKGGRAGVAGATA
uniref:Uncharacterized protein n=1 Tax=Arundo donax TaxID=35708 RepID=A0A0A8Z0N4_ARUDO